MLGKTHMKRVQEIAKNQNGKAATTDAAKHVKPVNSIYE
jgi:hypothetical protein